MKLELRHLARIEGHAHLVIDAQSGRLNSCRLDVVETPRLFEKILVGRHHDDVAAIVSRVCGVCSNAHTLASLAASERALGIAVSEQTTRLRHLLAIGEILQSHLLQLYFMAAPDYLGVASIFPLVQERRELVSRALRLKKLANDLCRVVGGRPVHPVTPRLGGFATLPAPAELQDVRKRLVAALADLESTVELFASFDYPAFERPSEYLSLVDEQSYPLAGGMVASSAGWQRPVAEYREVIREYQVPHSTASFAATQSGSFTVGPLARVRNGFSRLSPMARQVAVPLGIDAECVNPFRTLAARLVETVHWSEEAMHLIDDVLIDGLREEAAVRPEGGGYGVGAVEAPRGTLYHAYTYDASGCIVQADCLIPTAQNLASIEADLQQLVPRLLDGEREVLREQAEKLVRAYDPCISCATHMLKIDVC
ncbi:MAG: Ni/Fe hydrogenase subunit alpha [Desulfuromonas sp.]|nr:MAG: Ni/Fe hydrogenase subunit alpha [Desulfuromonas sp.]